jgi:putative hydrolase of the HAD superfamily
LLLLDLDNTLVDRDGAFRAWGARFLAGVGAPPYDLDWLVDADADGLTSRWDLADAIRERYRLRDSVVYLVDVLHEGQF